MSDVLAQLAEYDEGLARAMRELQEAELKLLGRTALTWLALVPNWTVELAERLEFPVAMPLEDWLTEAEAAGYCAREHSSIAGREIDHFWMTGATRADILGQEAAAGPTALRDLTAELGEKLLALDDYPLSPGLTRWAELARECRKRGRRTAEWLTQQIAAEIKAGRTDRALDWIDAGESLEPVLGRDIASAVARGKRRVNLVYRQRQDERFLDRFMRRDDQVAALESLLSGPDAVYALHFIGMGGVGKTMLIRYISAGFRPGGGEAKLVTSRVDFDHISPRYPREKPGQLLLEIATGLSAFVTDREQEEALNRFIKAVEKLHASSKPAHDRDPLANAAFSLALSRFVTLVKSLPQPVMLILDTCEELAKLHPAGGTVPAVEATFRILDMVHVQVPTLRVVLAGRRLLASKTDGWELDSSQPQPRSVVSLKERPYLRMHEVRGFTLEEARQFFAGRDVEVTDALLEAMLPTSRETGRVVGLVPAGHDDGESRFNPYDLALYADWIEERRRAGGDLTAEEILSGTADTYVDARIISRLAKGSPLLAALPVAVLLGRFDMTMLGAGLTLPPRELRRVFDELSEQEWVDAHGAEESGVTLLEVEPGLLPRLRSYFDGDGAGAERRAAFAESRRRLTAGLAELMKAPEFRGASIEWVDAALRLLEPQEAALVWEPIARRAVDEGQWSWAGTVCARMLGGLTEALLTGTGEDDGRGRLRGSIRALLASAGLQGDAEYDAADDWRLVLEEEAELHPLPAYRAWLRNRARLGIATADATHRAVFMSREDPDGWAALMGEALDADPADWMGRQTIAAAIQAIEALLDHNADPLNGELPGADDFLPVANLASRGDDALLACGALLCHARMLVRHGRFEEAEAAFAATEVLAPTDPAATSYCDWRAPAHARNRVRLEWLLSRAMRADAPAPAAWIEDSLPPEDADSEHLLSLALAERLAREPIPLAELEWLDDVCRDAPPFRKTCLAHEMADSLFARVALGWLSAGQPRRALALLELREQEPGAGRRGERTISEVATRLVDVVRWARWASLRDATVNQLSHPGSPDVRTAWATRTLVLGAPPRAVAGEQPSDPSLAHCAWRASAAVDTKVADDALRLLKGVDDDAPRLDSTDAQLRLDREEARLLRARLRPLARDVEVRPEPIAHAREQAEDLRQVSERLHLVEALDEEQRLLLRAWALSGEGGPEDFPVPHGARSWAETALDEGELLALRLPAYGRRLLALAVELYDRSGDDVGALVAQIRLLIAMLHDGDRGAARQLLTEIEPRYTTVQAALPPAAPGCPPDDALPPWDAVPSRAPDTGPWQRGGGAWSGWLNRLAQARRTAAIGQVFSVSRDAPAELQPVPAHRRRWRHLAMRVVRQVGSVMIYAWGVFCLGYAGYYGVDATRDVLRGLGWDPGIVLGALLSIVGWVIVGVAGSVLFLVPYTIGKRVFRAYRDLGVRLGVEAVIDIRPAGGSIPSTTSRDQRHQHAERMDAPPAAASEAELHVWLRSTTVLGQVIVAFHLLAGALGPVANPSATVSLHDQWPLWFPRPFVRSLRLARQMRVSRARLRVAPGCSAVSWELLLGLALSGTSDPSASFDFFREGSGAAAFEADPEAWRSGPVRVLCPVGLALAAEEDWATAPLPVEIHPASSLAEFELRKGARVLHLVGSPVQTSSGWSLRLDDQGVFAKSATGKPAVIAVDRLPLDGVGLVIVQDDSTEPTWDRDDPIAGFAASVAAAGAPAVLAIPGLPPQGAAVVVESLASEVAQATEPPTGDAVISWARSIRGALMFARVDAGLEHTTAAAAALRIQVFINRRPRGADRGDLAVGAHQRLEDLKRRAVRR